MEYRDVQDDPAFLDQMLEAAGGRRQVPVIVDAGKVTVGYGGT